MSAKHADTLKVQCFLPVPVLSGVWRRVMIWQAEMDDGDDDGHAPSQGRRTKKFATSLDSAVP